MINNESTGNDRLHHCYEVKPETAFRDGFEEYRDVFYIFIAIADNVEKRDQQHGGARKAAKKG